MAGMTARGRERLGIFVRRIRKSPEVLEIVRLWFAEHHPKKMIGDDYVRRPEFAQWMTGVTGISITTDAIGRLERGDLAGGPPMNVQIALIASGLLKYPDGTKYQHTDLVDVLTEDLNPLDGTRKERNGSHSR